MFSEFYFFALGSAAAYVEIFLPWIEVVLKDWKNINDKTCVFALRILSMMCSKECDFDVVIKSVSLSDIREIIRSGDSNSSLVAAYFELVHSLISHSLGCQWVLEKGILHDLSPFIRVIYGLL